VKSSRTCVCATWHDSDFLTIFPAVAAAAAANIAWASLQKPPRESSGHQCLSIGNTKAFMILYDAFLAYDLPPVIDTVCCATPLLKPRLERRNAPRAEVAVRLL